MSSKVQLRLALALIATFGLGTSASATTIDSSIDGPWLQFRFEESGSSAEGCFSGCIPGAGSIDALSPPWTYISVSATEVTVTDASGYGDMFSLYDFGILVGTTSFSPPGGGGSGDPDLALADPLFSHGSFSLGAGAHSLTIIADVSPSGVGSAYFRVDTVPEPGPLALLAGGLVGAVAIFRRRLERSAA